MFTIDCPHHGARTLIPLDAIRTLENTPGGILLEVECWCGATVMVHTGRRAHPAPTAPTATTTAATAASAA